MNKKTPQVKKCFLYKIPYYMHKYNISIILCSIRSTVTAFPSVQISLWQWLRLSAVIFAHLSVRGHPRTKTV